MADQVPIQVKLAHDEASRKHRRQLTWQILVPVILAGLLLIAALAWLILNVNGQAPSNATLGDLALILILLPWIFVSLVLLAATVALIFGISRLNKIIPGAGEKTLTFFDTVQDKLRSGANASVSPIFGMRELFARLSQVGDSFTQRFSRGK